MDGCGISGCIGGKGPNGIEGKEPNGMGGKPYGMGGGGWCSLGACQNIEFSPKYTQVKWKLWLTLKNARRPRPPRRKPLWPRSFNPTPRKIPDKKSSTPQRNSNPTRCPNSSEWSAAFSAKPEACSTISARALKMPFGALVAEVPSVEMVWIKASNASRRVSTAKGGRGSAAGVVDSSL